MAAQTLPYLHRWRDRFDWPDLPRRLLRRLKRPAALLNDIYRAALTIQNTDPCCMSRVMTSFGWTLQIESKHTLWGPDGCRGAVCPVPDRQNRFDVLRSPAADTTAR